jgi:acyl dehydratase
MSIRMIEINDEFVGKTKKMTWERIWAFSGGALITPGWPARNIHTDLEAAKKSGLTSVYVSATQYLGHLSELMIDIFGDDWLTTGKTRNLKFTAPVAEGDSIRTVARIKDRVDKGTETEYAMDVWCENQDGNKVLIGEATGFLKKG